MYINMMLFEKQETLSITPVSWSEHNHRFLQRITLRRVLSFSYKYLEIIPCNARQNLAVPQTSR